MRVRRALLSVSNREGLAEFAQGLTNLDIELYATSGTGIYLGERRVTYKSVSSLTTFGDGFISGRVKTLQAPIHAAILAERNVNEHLNQLATAGITPIDLVCVNLYAFDTLSPDSTTLREVADNIDIGGPVMIRSAAINYRHVAVLVDPAQYPALLEELRLNMCSLPEQTLEDLANNALEYVARYDTRVSQWFKQVRHAQRNEITLQHETQLD